MGQITGWDSILFMRSLLAVTRKHIVKKYTVPGFLIDINRAPQPPLLNYEY